MRDLDSVFAKLAGSPFRAKFCLGPKDAGYLGDRMPFRQARAAAGRSGVLRDEHRVPAPRRLLAVVERLRWRKALGNEIARMVEDPAPGGR